MGDVAYLPVDNPLPPPAPAPGPVMTEPEIFGITGYLRPADQLKALHRYGFTRARRAGTNGRVILERSHYDAVTRGQFGAPTNDPAPRIQAQPNRAGLTAFFGKRKAV